VDLPKDTPGIVEAGVFGGVAVFEGVAGGVVVAVGVGLGHN